MILRNIAPSFALVLMTLPLSASAAGPARQQVPRATSAQAISKSRPAPGALASKKLVKEMKGWVWNDGMASYTRVLPRANVKFQVLREDAYGDGKNHSQLVRVSGPGIRADGSLKLNVFNNVSAHDLYTNGMSDAAYKQAVDSRVAQDYVRVTIQYPDGTRSVVADGVKSKDVTVVPIDVKLRPGINTIHVDRTTKSGMIMGSSSMLGGRRVELKWDGPGSR